MKKVLDKEVVVRVHSGKSSNGDKEDTQMDLRKKLHAAFLRVKLLNGVPSDSFTHRLISSMSDDELIQKEKEHHDQQIAWALRKQS